MNPVISFVIPCHNHGRYLGDCLTSIFGQNLSIDFEVVVVDDASSDETSDVLRNHAEPRLRVIRHLRNQGRTHTVNEALSEARGNFIARIHPRDRYKPNFLAFTLQALRDNPSCALAYGDAVLINENGSVTDQRFDQEHGGKSFAGNEFLKLLYRNFVCPATVIARKEAWQTALPLPPAAANLDWYFPLQMSRNFDFCYIPQVVSEYRVYSATHRAKRIKNRADETSTIVLLDFIFGHAESDAALQRRKRSIRGRVYSSNYLTFADHYFALGMDSDARRCYLSAARFAPLNLLQRKLARGIVTTLVGRELYNRSVAFLRSSPLNFR